jgi:hypothetical protein
LEGASRIAAGISVALAAPAIAQESQPVAGSDLVRREGAYIGSRACRECHDDRHASWDATFHSSMTQLPARESVLGRFDGREVALFGAAAIPHEKDGRFSFRLPAIGGEPAREAEVALCTGSNRYQQYFERVESPSGAFRRIPLLWNAVEERWWHVNGVFLEPDSDDWSRHQSLWNENCIFCHTTAPEPRLELARAEGGTATKHFDSHVGELGIACESCHGPGADHARVYAEHRGDPDAVEEPAIVDPRELPQRKAVAVCGQCHSQRLPAPREKLWTYLDGGPTFRPGDTLEDHVEPVTRDTPPLDPSNPGLFRDRFWSDGTARLTAYEYLGVTRSPCFRGGRMTCSSCHVMHSGDVHGQIEPEMGGDKACTQCHAAIAEDVRAHTHHAPESAGSRCLECHMPRIVYGVLNVHRSHRIESPDARRDVEAGRPHACTLCHFDRTAEWAAKAMREWWGERYEPPRSRPDGAPLDVAEAIASLHAGDAVQRAVYARAFGRADSALSPRESAMAVAHLIVALGDGYPAIRTLARRSLMAVDARAGLGLASEIAALEPLAAPEERTRRVYALLGLFPEAARGHFDAPQVGSMLSRDFELDLVRVRALLELQSDHVISIGE